MITKLQIGDMKLYEQEWLKMYPLQPTEFEKHNGLFVNRFGANIALPHYHIGPRVTPYYYLLCILEGEGTFIQQEQRYTLQANDIFCLFPQVIHEYYCNPEKPIKKLILAFSGKQALQALALIGLTPSQPHLDNRVTHHTINAFNQLIQNHEQPLARLTHLYSIFQSLVLYDNTKPAHDEQADDWLLKGKHLIEHHFSESMAIEEISDQIGIERTHFSKMFTKRFGLSPMQYMLQLRMNEAMLLLQHKEYTILEIAQAVGYQDISSFSKAFKKRYAISPLHYRQHYHEDNKKTP